MNLIISPEVAAIYNSYSESQKQVLLKLREIIFDTAKKLNDIDEVEESLKWNQPSYVVKHGSPIRLGVFDSNNVAIFFNCNTTLVKNFRILFNDILEFSNNRAIILNPKIKLPINELMVCIEMALTYHKIKFKLNEL